MLLATLQFGHRAIRPDRLVKQFQHDGRAQFTKIDAEPAAPAFQIGVRGRFLRNELIDEFLAVTLLVLQFAQQLRLLQNHLGHHPHEFANLAHVIRLAGNPDHAAHLPAHHQRDIDTGLGAFQAARHRRIDLHRPRLRQGKARPGVQFTDALRIAAPQDESMHVHDVDVEWNDLHRSFNDFLRQSGFERNHRGLSEKTGFFTILAQN